MALERTDMLQECSASIFRVTRIGELRTIAVTSNQSISSQHARFLVTANVVPSSPILFTLMMEAIGSSDTSVLTRPTWHNIPEDGILHVMVLFANKMSIQILKCE
jgi:hypothetical protein